jgi:probable rRNA maturation factor
VNAAHHYAPEVAPVVQIRNLQRKIRVNPRSLQRFAERALTICQTKYGTTRAGKTLPKETFILLISDRRMADLHRRFLNQTGPTDVITFHHGEIFISVPTARRQSKRFGTPLIREMQLYIVHALLHLHGFNDVTAAQKRQIRAAEARVMHDAVV